MTFVIFMETFTFKVDKIFSEVHEELQENSSRYFHKVGII